MINNSIYTRAVGEADYGQKSEFRDVRIFSGSNLDV